MRQPLDADAVLALEAVSTAGSAAGVPPIRELTLALRPGERVTVRGPAGFARALARVALGLDAPRSGAVRLLGQALAQVPEEGRRALRARCGVVDGRNALPSNLTVAENITLPLRYRGVSSRDALARATELLAALGLADAAEASPAHLDERRTWLAALARAVIDRPALLIAAEAPQNPESRGSLLDRLRLGPWLGDAALLLVAPELPSRAP